MATDIAFALAVLAVVGSHLPPALRAFLLTLAVVDDMGAITVIALFFSDTIDLIPLVIAGALLVLYFFLQRARVTSPWLYLPLALTVWALFHDAGVHATVAGVLLGLLTRVKPDPDEERSPAERLEHRMRPISAAVAVPVFAFFTAGVTLTSVTSAESSLTSRSSASSSAWSSASWSEFSERVGSLPVSQAPNSTHR